MPRLSKLPLLGSVVTCLTTASYFLASISPGAGTLASPQITATVTPTPTPTPTAPPPVFSVRVKVLPETTEPEFAQVMKVRVLVDDYSQACGYLVYDITLSERGEDAPIFEFLTPQSVGPPVYQPAAFALKAVKGGTVEVFARVYGETNCGGGWSWVYTYGWSEAVTVTPERTYLPLIGRAEAGSKNSLPGAPP